MNFKQLLADEDAVSPVIGVILMVAITVILAAVIGTFVLGLGDQVQNTSPQASFTFNYDTGIADGNIDCSSADANSLVAANTDNRLETTHDGGDKISAGDLSLVDGADGPVAWDATCSPHATNSDITAGNTLSTEVDSDDTVRVVWQAGSDNSATLGRWNGPDA